MGGGEIKKISEKVEKNLTFIFVKAKMPPANHFLSGILIYLQISNYIKFLYEIVFSSSFIGDVELGLFFCSKCWYHCELDVRSQKAGLPDDLQGEGYVCNYEWA